MLFVHSDLLICVIARVAINAAKRMRTTAPPKLTTQVSAHHERPPGDAWISLDSVLPLRSLLRCTSGLSAAFLLLSSYVAALFI